MDDLHQAREGFLKAGLIAGGHLGADLKERLVQTREVFSAQMLQHLGDVVDDKAIARAIELMAHRLHFPARIEGMDAIDES